MTTRFTHETRQWAKQILAALLPSTASVDIALYRDGWQMKITICGKNECHLYELTPPLTEFQLVSIANQWKTGERVAPPLSENTAGNRLGSIVETADDLKTWVRSARKGQRVIYFLGNLAQFRVDASKEVVALQAKGDSTASGNGLSAAERVLLTKLQTTTALLVDINTLQLAGMIEVTQARMADGEGFVYYATKR